MSVQDTREFEEMLAGQGLQPAELMRRAGAVVAMQAARLADEGGVVLVLCGAGNNGGDGWVAADDLARHGYAVSVASSVTPAVIRSEPARRAAQRAIEMGVPVHVAPDEHAMRQLLGRADVLVDACFGTGFHGELPEPFASWVAWADDEFCGKVIAVDVPSGVDATTGEAAGAYFQADATVTMFAAKPGLVSGVGRSACGRIVVASLLGGDEGLQAISDAASAFVLEDRDYLDVLPALDAQVDKYGRGRVLVVAGSSRFPGAAVLAATGAARAGAGYVTLAVPAPMVPVAQMQLPAVPVVGLPADADGSFAPEAATAVAKLAVRADVVVAGPGMTIAPGACDVVRTLLQTSAGLVLDADALNAVVKICAGSAEERPQALRREAPLVLTPHRRELARLAGGDLSRTASLAGAMEVAQSLAWAVGSGDFCVIAKGADTAVATVDSTLVPEPGPCALASAGTGDVLAGVVGGMLAQAMAQLGPDEDMDPSDLLMLAAAADRVHGVAGELAARARGMRGVMAQDVAAVVGLAADELERRAERDFDEGDEGDGVEDGLPVPDESLVKTAPEALSQRMASASALAQRSADEDLTPEEPQAPVVAPAGEGGGASDMAGATPASPAPAVATADETTVLPATTDEGAAAGAPAADGEGEGLPAATREVPAAPVATRAPTSGPAADAGEDEGRPVASPSAEEAPGASGDETAASSAASVPSAPAVPPAPAVQPAVSVPPAPAVTVGAGTPAAAPTPGSPAVSSAGASGTGADAVAPDAAGTSGSPSGSPAEPSVPPFLATCKLGDGPAATVPPFLAEAAGRGADGAFREPSEGAAPRRELTPEEREAAALAEFHERATLHVGDEPAVPAEERPSASRRVRRLRKR